MRWCPSYRSEAVGSSWLATSCGQFVAALAGTNANGNLVMFADGTKPILVGYPCSSMHNMTAAIMLWAAVTQLLRIPVGPHSLAICAVAMAGNVLVNGMRLRRSCTTVTRSIIGITAMVGRYSVGVASWWSRW